MMNETRYNNIYNTVIDKKSNVFELLFNSKNIILREKCGSWGGCFEYETIATYSWEMSDEEIIENISKITKFVNAE